MKLFNKTLLTALTAFFVAAGAAAYAAAPDTVGLVNSQKIIFQHPRFDGTTKLLLMLSKAVEGSAAQVMQAEQDPARKEMIVKYSTQVSEFAQMDRAIEAEKDEKKKAALWESRQKRLDEFQANLMNPIMDECMKAVQAVMKARGMTVVIELDSVYYGGTDITEDVIKRLKR